MNTQLTVGNTNLHMSSIHHNLPDGSQETVSHHISCTVPSFPGESSLAALVRLCQEVLKQTNQNSPPRGAPSLTLHQGEMYAGILIGKDGATSHHLVLVAAEAKVMRWTDAKEWAVTVGEGLPTRREQALLYANLKEQFNSDWYWSSEQDATYPDSAWMQGFTDGSQDFSHKSSDYCARAVRRIPVP